MRHHFLFFSLCIFFLVFVFCFFFWLIGGGGAKCDINLKAGRSSLLIVSVSLGSTIIIIMVEYIFQVHTGLTRRMTTVSKRHKRIVFTVIIFIITYLLFFHTGYVRPTEMAKLLFSHSLGLLQGSFYQPSGLVKEMYPQSSIPVKGLFRQPSRLVKELYPQPSRLVKELYPKPSEQMKESFPQPSKLVNESHPQPSKLVKESYPQPPMPVKGLLRQPSGLVKGFYPQPDNMPYKHIPFSDGFRYPLELDMREIANKKLKGDKIDVAVINPHPFSYIFNPVDLCSAYHDNHRLRLLILVKSAASHFELRNVIRTTWGTRVKDDRHMEFAFLLGHSGEHRDIIDKEQRTYGDIIQENFIDAYQNNTYKTIMAYNWVVKYCDVARMVLFLDDDAYLNMDVLNQYLLSIQNNKSVESLFSGYISPAAEPCRDRKLPWYVSWKDYPYDRYPDYLGGFAMFASMDVVKLFQAVIPYVRHLPFDDVFIGIVAYKLNITLTRNFYMDEPYSNNHDRVLELIVTHGFGNPEYYLSTYKRQFNSWT